MPDRHEAVPDWMVERLAAGDLPPGEAGRVRARLEARGELGRLDDLAAANRAFLDAHPADRIAAEIRRRGRVEPVATSRQPRRRRFAAAGALAASAAVLSIWLLRRPGAEPPAPAPEPETVRLKGLRPHLVVYRKTASGADRVADGERVRPGDTIQVAYVAAGRRFGVIASVDARGTVTLHLPEEPGDARALRADGETPLPSAFVLDDSPGFERFVFVTGDRAFASSLVVDALGAPGRALPPHLSIIELTLEKELP